MTIALFAFGSVPLDEVSDLLCHEDVKAQALKLNARPPTDSNATFKIAVLIAPKHGAGDVTDRISNWLGKQTILWLCAPQPHNADRDLLLKQGAAEIITPRSWRAEDIAERILAQLILTGDVLPNSSGSLRGATRTMRELYESLSVIAPLSDPILIMGETGTGKELVAREIHRLSSRKDKLITKNCAELSVELAGSELFGHKKGSFTGATETRKGLIAEAGAGTIFLDEIGELDLKAQGILLRALEEKKIRRVGANELEDVHARFVLATNRILELECEAGQFRQDLYERIRGFSLELKPLRERRADIPLLVQWFVAEFNSEFAKNLEISPVTYDCLFEHDWPGNIRELRAAVRKAAAFSGENGCLSGFHLREATLRRHKLNKKDPSDSPQHQPNSIAFDPQKDTWRDLLRRAQQTYFHSVLKVTAGNREKAILLSGLSRTQFYEKLKDLDSDDK